MEGQESGIRKELVVVASFLPLAPSPSSSSLSSLSSSSPSLSPMSPTPTISSQCFQFSDTTNGRCTLAFTEMYWRPTNCCWFYHVSIEEIFRGISHSMLSYSSFGIGIDTFNSNPLLSNDTKLNLSSISKNCQILVVWMANSKCMLANSTSMDHRGNTGQGKCSGEYFIPAG